jgi:hypothetical protein|eukprot:scaffold15241_cov421-Alexandrium_tamarense.AAC.4
MPSRLLITTLLALNPLPCSAWSSAPNSPSTSASSVHRRDFFRVIGSTASATLLLPSLPSNAAAAPTFSQTKDADNVVKGYNRLQYLLDNWEDETTICKIGQETTFGDKCERTPVKVMDYLGFKSTNDPLFKADATMLRLKSLVPSDKEEEFYEAIDSYAQNAEEANSMAFVSSWGEANPGGGKDRVRLFIERAKKNVIVSRDSLKTVMDILELNP